MLVSRSRSRRCLDKPNDSWTSIRFSQSSLRIVILSILALAGTLMVIVRSLRRICRFFATKIKGWTDTKSFGSPEKKYIKLFLEERFTNVHYRFFFNRHLFRKVYLVLIRIKVSRNFYIRPSMGEREFKREYCLVFVSDDLKLNF